MVWVDDPCDDFLGLRADLDRVAAPLPPMVADIQAAVAFEFDIALGEMRSAHRKREFARPRQVAMYLSRKLTKRSMPEIGMRFGGRDHTTVIHAIRQIEHLRKIDPELDLQVRRLMRQFAGAGACL